MDRIALTRALFTGAAVSLLSVSAAAQQVVPPPPPAQPPPAAATPAIDEAAVVAQQKMQVRSFEAVLRAAVETGGRRVAERAVQAVPDVQLAMDGDPLVLGVPHPDGGWVFNVQVPDIMQSYLRIFDAMNAQRRGLRNVTTDAPTALEPDPFAPGKEYAHYVREALIEAMIENSHALNVNSTSELVIVASVPDAVRRNPLDTSRSIILSIRGEYLAAYRQRLISKDDVKSKVVDRRF